MKGRWYFLGYVLVIVFIFIGMAVSAPKRPTTVAELALYRGADRQQILEEGAKKEGKLTLYTTGVLTGAVRPIVDAFQKRYPYIKVEIWRAGQAEISSRLLDENKAGRYVADVIGIDHPGQMLIREGGIPQPFYSPNLTYIEEGAITKAPDGGAFAAGYWNIGIGMGYNTKLITREQVPKTYQDLLDPKWKGKLAIAGSMTGASWMGAMLVTYGEDFVKQVAKQKFDVHMVSARAVLDMIINGEYAGSPSVFDSHATKSKQEGAPVEWVPLEPVSVYVGQIALFKHSPHPNAAMLFIDFELSKEAGELYMANGYYSPRKDVSGERTYKKFYGSRSTKEIVEWDELFGKLFIKK